MDENEFPSNNRIPKMPSAPKEPEKKVEKIATGKAVTRRKPLGRRFADTFIAEDISSVSRYVVMEVLIPAAKDMILEIGREGLDRLLFGERGGRRNVGFRSSGSAGHVSYNRYSSNSSSPPWRRDEDRTISRRARAQHDFDEVILESRQEANDILDKAYELLSRYNEVTVADIYEMAGIDTKHTDVNWGWRKLEGSKVSRVREGYVLDLPRPEQLD